MTSLTSDLSWWKDLFNLWSPQAFPFNKKVYYFKLSGDNLWVVKRRIQLLLRQLYENLLNARCLHKNFCFPQSFFWEQTKHTGVGWLLPQESPVIIPSNGPCCRCPVTNWNRRLKWNGLIKTTCQGPLSILGNMYRGTISWSTQLNTVNEAGLCLLKAQRLVWRCPLSLYFLESF